MTYLHDELIDYIGWWEAEIESFIWFLSFDAAVRQHTILLQPNIRSS